MDKFSIDEIFEKIRRSDSSYSSGITFSKSIFVKYINAAQGWPDSDYFSAFRYIRSQKALKLGIHWPFYVK